MRATSHLLHFAGLALLTGLSGLFWAPTAAAGVVDPNGDLEVISGDPLAGQFSARITIDDDDRVYLREESPEGLDVYRARFLWRPATLMLAPGKRLKLLTGFSENPAQKRILTFTVRDFFEAPYQEIRLKVREDDGAWMTTQRILVPMNLEVVPITIEWRRASGPDAEDGLVRLFLDGLLAREILGVDNSTWSLDRVHFGVVSAPKPGTTGTLEIDSFESWAR
ncbi:MAG: hypothetical protein SX243_23605 [Acidobacteriota bacterium]|nr:hypothetical protein [Acidobacteriota bacterium]